MSLALIIQLLSGVAGGNLAGSLMKKFSLGTLGNSVLGILGGGVGGYILNMLGMGSGMEAESSMAIGSILSSVAGGGVGGGVLMAIVGFVKNAMSGSSAS